MIERIAKAISDAIDPTSGDPIGVTFHHSEFVEGETIQEQLEQVKSICLAAARAAIEAMRNPTAEMVEAGLSAVSDVTVREPKGTAWDALRFHRAMIDAALSQSPSSLPSEDR